MLCFTLFNKFVVFLEKFYHFLLGNAFLTKLKDRNLGIEQLTLVL